MQRRPTCVETDPAREWRESLQEPDSELARERQRMGRTMMRAFGVGQRRRQVASLFCNQLPTMRPLSCAAALSVALLVGLQTEVLAQTAPPAAAAAVVRGTIDVDQIRIFTKIAAPFSMPYGEPDIDSIYPAVSPEGLGSLQAKGYTIDYIVDPNGLLAQVPVASGDPPLRSLTTVEMLSSNAAVFHMVGNTSYCDPAVNPRRLCIGAAAISMTTGRETHSGDGDPRLDFLPSYYMAGLQILARTDTSIMTVLSGILLKGGAILLSLVIVLVSLMFVFAPIMWVFEAYFTPPDRISIFHSTDAAMMDMSDARFDDNIDEDDVVEISEARRFKAELQNAFTWTAILFSGGTPGKPASVPGRIVRAIGMAMNSLLYVAIISAITTVMTLGFQTTGIKESVTSPLPLPPHTAHTRPTQHQPQSVVSRTVALLCGVRCADATRC
jgi:hypothetical protein